MTPQQFIDTISAAATACYQSTGIWASATIAQGALESGWGNSELVAQAKNLFGIKADASWVGDKVSLPTTEYVNGVPTPCSAMWRVYPTWDACLADHAAFFKQNPRYAEALAATTAEDFVAAIRQAGYSTDPAYVSKIVGIMRMHNLQQYDVLST